MVRRSHGEETSSRTIYVDTIVRCPLFRVDSCIYSNIMRIYGVMITMKRRFKTVALDIARGIDADELHIIDTHTRI